jgi:membrane-associated protease RseP (regulator of RpoE activity)
MDLVIYIAGAVVFFGLVMASIALHEIGHLVPGKLFNVKTTEYFVGFGRTLWSRRRGETEYGVKAVPVGGYVRLVGMFPPRKNRPGEVRRVQHWAVSGACR